jgi:hypothetical protein
MLSYCFILLFFMFAIVQTNAGTVATIGDQSVIINKSTSCSSKTWKANMVFACECCIVKQKTITKDSSQKIIDQCLKGKYCTKDSLDLISPNTKKADDVVNFVLWNDLDTPEVNVDPKFLDKNGKIKPENLVEFLGTLRHDIRDLREPLYTDVSMPQCLSAKSLGAGGVNTAQLFMISVDDRCISGNKKLKPMTPKYIIKESSKKSKEVVGLRKLHQSELMKLYDLSNPKRDKNKLAIAFDLLDIKYYFKGQSHYLTFLPIAPGKSLMSLAKDLAAAIHSGNTADEHAKAERLYNSYLAYGKVKGEELRRFMVLPKGKVLLGKSIVHGDAHIENVFEEGVEIDPETYALSLEEKRPVAVDLFIFIAFPLAQLKDQYLFPKIIGLSKWNNLTLKPFVLGIVSNWPKEQQPQVLGELRSLYTNLSETRKFFTERSFFINPAKYKASTKDINRVFDNISKELGVTK